MSAAQLVVVIPVFDEAERIEAVVREWDHELDQLEIAAEIRVYDDGSRDGTPDRLARLAAELVRLRWTSHLNRGHGPTILRGYREADTEWIAQADGDGEIPAAAFAELWRRRERADLLLGRRVGRRQRLGRRLVSLAARATVRALAGRAPGDVNVPFRLMRRSALAPLVERLPDEMFAPNVALCALAVRAGLEVIEVPVPFVSRRPDAGSLVAGRLARAAARSLLETVRAVRGSGSAA